MGQRTQSVIEIKNIKKHWKTGEIEKQEVITASYHNQWGFSKMQLMDIIRMITTYFPYSNTIEMPEQLHKAVRIDNKEYETGFVGKATPRRVIKWLNTQCNNNGGFLLKLIVCDFTIESGKLYLFNDPETEGINEVNRVVSLKEYLDYYPRYFDFDFIEIFRNLLRFYNIELVEELE